MAADMIDAAVVGGVSCNRGDFAIDESLGGLISSCNLFAASHDRAWSAMETDEQLVAEFVSMEWLVHD